MSALALDAPAGTARTAHTARTAAASPMSVGDAAQWDALEAWKRHTLGGPTRGRAALDAGLGTLPALSGLGALPGLDALLGPAVRAVDDVLDRLDALGVWCGRATLGADGVVTAFRRAGYAVGDIGDVRALDVDAVHAVRPALDRWYAVASVAQGGLTGTLAGLGPMLSTGALAGLAGLVASLGVDSVLTAAVCARAVAHVGLYYGFDAADPDEQAHAAGVLAVAVAAPRDRPAAYGALRGEGRPATTSSRSSGELARALPALGVGVGAVCSARLVIRVLDTAEHLYRERFLREKYARTGARAASGSSS